MKLSAYEPAAPPANGLGVPPDETPGGVRCSPDPGAQSDRPARFHRPLAIVLLVLLPGLLFALYRPSFTGPLYFDSIVHLQDKTNMHVVSLDARSLRDAMREDFGKPGFNRPVARLTFALDYYFSGPSPEAFRRTNVGLHYLSALAVFFLSVTILQAPRVQSRLPQAHQAAVWVGAVSALLWALHPVQTNAVTYVIQRMASLAGLFYFLALACYLLARQAQGGWSHAWGLLFVVASLLGLGCKESVVTLLLIVPLAEVLLLERHPGAGFRSAGLVLGLLGLAGLAALAFSNVELRGYFSDLYAKTRITPWQHLLAAVTVQYRYLLLLFVPDHRLLTLDAEPHVPRGLFDPPLVAGVVVALLALAALAVTARKRKPLFAFAVLGFFLAQVIESLMLPQDIYVEHRLYVPSAFLALWLYASTYEVFVRGDRRVRVLGTTALALLLTVVSYNTHARNGIWGNAIHFLDDNAAKASRKPRAILMLAHGLLEVHEYQEAERLFLLAKEMKGPSLGLDENIEYNLAYIAYREGRLDNAARIIERVMDARSATPWDSDTLRWKMPLLLATISLEQGDLKRSREIVTRALADDPLRARLLGLLGFLELREGNHEESERLLRRTLSLAPAKADTWNHLGMLLYETDRLGEALDAFRAAAAFDPRSSTYAENVRLAERMLAGAVPGTESPE